MQAIKLDVTIRASGDPLHDLEQVKRAEQLGYDAAWVTETAHNPFIPVTIAAKETSRIRLGTQAALAFPRSPMVTAQIAWDLSRQSEGRFVLGLGRLAQARPERRSNEEWRDTVGRMREYIESLRAIWDTFQTDARLRYRGEHYQFRLMAPFFNPGPISHPAIPIYLTGDSPSDCQLAGELGQGLQAHSFHTPSYLREVLLPALETGLRSAGRARRDIVVTAPVCVISARSESERRSALRKRLAHCVSAPSFRRVMSFHGWEALADEALGEFAVIAEPGDVYAQILGRYGGIADRISLEWRTDNPALYETIAGCRE